MPADSAFYGMMAAGPDATPTALSPATGRLEDMRQAPRKSTRRAAALAGALRQAALTIRVDFGAFGYLGPGKIALMELISKHGSISAAGKEMGMSYRRAWLLVDEINHIFREPLVETQMGGTGGGGARLTKLGRDVIGRYRAIEGAAAASSASDLRALRALLPDRPLRRPDAD
jgi:molybdate transport system regulatory protein